MQTLLFLGQFQTSHFATLWLIWKKKTDCFAVYMSFFLLTHSGWTKDFFQLINVN